jgi:hypothetical protein
VGGRKSGPISTQKVAQSGSFFEAFCATPRRMKTLCTQVRFRAGIGPTISLQPAVKTTLALRLSGLCEPCLRPCDNLIGSSHQRGTNSRLVPRCRNVPRAAAQTASSCDRKRLGVNEVDVFVATHEAIGGHDAETCCPARGSQPGAQAGRHAREGQEVDQKVYNMFWRWQTGRVIFLSIQRKRLRWPRKSIRQLS